MEIRSLPQITEVQLVVTSALGVDVPWNCDINGDGLVTALDVQFIVNTALGLETRIPTCVFAAGRETVVSVYFVQASSPGRISGASSTA